MVLIDAAKGSATSPPDLSKYKADFVVVSFYKVFMQDPWIKLSLFATYTITTFVPSSYLATQLELELLLLEMVNF